ncbi:hypothetical protein DY000_02034847 [Brassica cretica]|uniref:Uncharacterized protein n=1 Tax=Brassica cretica TaxID=69181 RepID=A0ABQ7DKW7_BRACR|nr:hypothetical protein DY000_02034847 [Brassica cretica]
MRDSLDEPGVIWRRLCGSEFGHEYRLGARKMWKPAKDFRLGLRRELEVETFAPYCKTVFWNTEMALQSLDYYKSHKAFLELSIVKLGNIVQRLKTMIPCVIEPSISSLNRSNRTAEQPIGRFPGTTSVTAPSSIKA